MDNRRDPDLIRHVASTLPSVLGAHDLVAQVRSDAASLAEHDADLIVALRGEGVRLELAVDVRQRAEERTLGRLPHTPDTLRLLVVPRIGRAARERLRARRYNFADLAGSLHIRAAGVHIDVEGRQPMPLSPRTRERQQVNPFSKRASRVLRVLCAQAGAPVDTHALMARTGLSRAWVFAVMQVLTTRGYVTHDSHGWRLERPVELLRAWIDAYDWRQNTVRHYVVPFGQDELPARLHTAFGGSKVPWAFTLLSAAERRIGHVHAPGLTQIYALPPDAQALRAALDALHAEPVRSGGNLMVMAPPYHGDAVFMEAAADATDTLVSDVQLLIDLAHYPVRGPEAAEQLIRRRIAPAFALSRADVTRLVEAVA